tara:strand:- start:1320 stop:2102 length:783 start_codon:yes stop_codon:yes gene_type:complete
MKLLKNNNNLDTNIAVSTLIGILAIIIVGIYNTAFKNGKFTCNKYILNTYLYILIALVIMSLQVLAFDLHNISPRFFNILPGIWSFVLILFLVIGMLILTMTINPENILLKHISWFVLIIILGCLAYPAYYRSKNQNTLLPVLLSLVAILVFFSIIAFIKPEWISFSWGPILLFLLVGVIITYFIFLLTIKDRTSSKNKKFIRGISYFIIVLFIFFIMYDTKKIIVAAKLCREGTADYINQSLGIVIDALNIFQSLVNIH